MGEEPAAGTCDQLTIVFVSATPSGQGGLTTMVA
jgi:hypothetical protein